MPRLSIYACLPGISMNFVPATGLNTSIKYIYAFFIVSTCIHSTQAVDIITVLRNYKYFVVLI